MAKVNYINNKELAEAVREWREGYLIAKELQETDETALTPPATDYMANAFYQIASKYSRKPNFSGYTFREDMVSEAVYLCLKYAHNFNFEKSPNAFAYFTMIAHNAFIQVINREKGFVDFKFNYAKELNPKFEKLDYSRMISDTEE